VDTYVTGFTYDNSQNKITIKQNIGQPDLSVFITTVSGLIITELGIIPKQGQKLIWNKLEFEVIDMDGVKIDKILITNLKR
jgi:CBS domain containing-hemolysin-like protein